MNSTNTLSMKSNSRNAIFEMNGEGSIWSRRWPVVATEPTHDEVVINIEAKLPAIRGGIEYDCNPVLILSWLENPYRFEHLLHRTIEIPKSFDAFVNDHVTSFYFFQHLDFDDVVIRFVERDGERYRIQATGTAPDLASHSRMEIQIDTIVRRTER